MDFLLLLFYLGFCLSFLAVRSSSEETQIPLWLGGSFTPHGGFLNYSPGRWIVFLLWALILGGLIQAGHFLYEPAIASIGVGLVALLFIAGFLAISFRLSYYSSNGEAGAAAHDTLPAYERFRILCSSPHEYARLCQEPDISSRLTDTPYTFLKEISKIGLKAALKIFPYLIYQPVVKEITQKTDEFVTEHQTEIHSHAEKALAARSEADGITQKLTTLRDKIDLLEKSESQARKDLERMQTRNRTAPAKNFSEMSLEELKTQRTALLEELRKIDQTLRGQQPSTTSTASLPNMNP